MALGVDLVRSGVNLAEDAARLAKSKNSITRSFDTMMALVAPRPGVKHHRDRHDGNGENLVG